MQKITNKKAILALFFLCWFAYFSSYLGRLNYSAAISDFLAIDRLTKTQAGLINTAYFTFYAVGQIVNGYLGDKLCSKKMMTFGLLFSSCCNLLMGFSSTFSQMIILWALNGYFQSMTWPPIIRIFTTLLSKESAVHCLTNISSTVAVGTLGSYFISALILKYSSWPFVFYVPAFIMLGISLLFFITYDKLEQYKQPNSEANLNLTVDHAYTTQPTVSISHILTSPLILLIIIPTLFHGVLKDGLTGWVPTFINETFNAGSVTALLVSMVLPVVNVLGAYLVTFLRRWISRELDLAALFFFSTVVALLCLILFGKYSLLISLIALSMCSCFMLAINFIFITLVPLQYAAYGRSATLSGFLNATAYLGAALSSTFIGFLAQNYNWNMVMFSFILMTSIATFICLLGKKLNSPTAL